MLLVIKLSQGQYGQVVDSPRENIKISLLLLWQEVSVSCKVYKWFSDLAMRQLCSVKHGQAAV